MRRSNPSPYQGLTPFNPEAVPFMPGARAPETRPMYESHRGLDLGQALEPVSDPEPSPANIVPEDDKYAGMSKVKRRKAKRKAERKAAQLDKKTSGQLYVSSSGPSGVFAEQPTPHQQLPSLARSHVPTSAHQQQPSPAIHSLAIRNAQSQPVHLTPPASTSGVGSTLRVPAALAHLPPLRSIQQVSPFARPDFATTTSQQTSPFATIPGLGAHIPGLASTQQVPKEFAPPPSSTTSTQQPYFPQFTGPVLAANTPQQHQSPQSIRPLYTNNAQRYSAYNLPPRDTNTYQHIPPFIQPAVATNAYQHQPTFNIYAGHYPPTIEDMNATDEEAILLLNAITNLSPHALLAPGPSILASDARPLTPDQINGARYGTGPVGGIDTGATWNPPAPLPGEPFRIRPRNHEGWGGLQWALNNGWRVNDQSEATREPVPDFWSGVYDLMKIGWDWAED
ncbi:hypothetical protein NX059_001186 [Plenodomus lindquistii]|nr:hypothetical protein NX059_001186 [Plenodomus lindquistii]